MEKYKILKKLGDGTFGSVSQAKNIKNGEIVAIKKLKEKFETWEACVSLQEIKSLMKLNHPNIVQLHEVIKHKNELYLVFEYLDRNIYQLLKDRKKPLTHFEQRNILFQTLQGIYFIHCQNYFHRDLKPENLLEFKNTVKIADFGLAKQTHLKPPFTEYVSTRWYRAPELILGDLEYGKEVDMFAIGCIFGELLGGGVPVFPGKNEVDQMDKIVKILGRFDSRSTAMTSGDGVEYWEKGVRLIKKLDYNFPSGTKPINKLADVMSKFKITNKALDLLQKMLIYDPKKRITALEALQHPYFQVTLPVEIEPHQEYSNYDHGARAGFNHEGMVGRGRRNEQNRNSYRMDDGVGGSKNSGENQLKKTSFYLRKARYKPGVNLAEMLRKSGS